MENNKRIIVALLIVAAIIGGYFFFTNRQAQEAQKNSKPKEVSKTEIFTKEFAAKYAATTNWEENLNYTRQAQERLVTGKPVLFKGQVDDIFNRDGKTFIRFSATFPSSVDYVLELECNQQIVDKYLQQHGSQDSLPLFNDYLVVATIQNVSKPVFALKGSVLSGEDVEINIRESDLFTAKGTCLDIAGIENE